MTAKKPTAIVYIDGLNLYKRILKLSPKSKWLNLLRMCELLLPTHDILLVRYFTSRIAPQPHDILAVQRQNAYLLALKSLGPRLEMHFGRMSAYTVSLPLVPVQTDSNGETTRVKVRKIDEKGSDVALASYMVMDAALGKADLYVLLSSDSDFEPTLNILNREIGVSTGLIFGSEFPPRALISTKPLIVKKLRSWVLYESQLENEITTSGSVIKRPSSWS